MHRLILLSLIVGCMSLSTKIVTAGEPVPGNLVPDPAFKEVDFGALSNKTTWLDHPIIPPSEAKVDKQKGMVTLVGGKTFLHSSVFDVEGGKKYYVGLKARGSGVVAIECLWWSKYNGGLVMASPHRTVAVKPTALGKESQTIAGSSVAPKDATKADLRIIVEKGTAMIAEPTAAASVSP